jgi:hypothetical protein
MQERLFTQMRLFSDLYRGGFSRQHPGRNLQTLPGWVNDTDRSIPPLGPAEDLHRSATKRVKGVEDLNIRIIRAQGILGVGAFIPICIVWCLGVASPWTAAIG